MPYDDFILLEEEFNLTDDYPHLLETVLTPEEQFLLDAQMEAEMEAEFEAFDW